MIDRESVLRHCIVAIQNSAREVRSALDACLSADSPETLHFATRRLRDALVSLAAGYEAGSHDGATFKARVEAAKAALAAWDGIEEDAPVAKGRLRGV